MTITALYEAESLKLNADQCKRRGQASEAVGLFKKAVDVERQTLGPDSATVAQTLDRMGAVLADPLEKYSEAEQAYQEAIAIFEKAYYPGHFLVGRVVEHLADVHCRQGKLQEGEDGYKRAVEIYEKTLSGDHRIMIESLHKLSHVYRELGKLEEAETLLKKAMKAADTPLGPIEEFQWELGQVYQAQGKSAEAEAMFQLCIKGYSQRGKTQRLVKSLRAYAELLKSHERKADAEEMEARAEALRSTTGFWNDDAGLYPSTLIRA